MRTLPYAEEGREYLLDRTAEKCNALIAINGAEALTSALSHLEAEHRVILALLYFEKLRIDEIAFALGTRVGHTIHMFARAVNALEAQLETERVFPWVTQAQDESVPWDPEIRSE